MLSNKEIVCPNNLLNAAHKKKGVKAGIVNAGKPLPMLSVQDAVNENLIVPVFIGDEKEIMKLFMNLLRIILLQLQLSLLVREKLKL